MKLYGRSKKMRVLRIEPGQDPELIDIENKLESLQQEVGGYIECVTLISGELEMIVNEEGWILDLPFNELASVLSNHHIAGTAIIASSAGEEFIDLDPKHDYYLKRKLSQWKMVNE
jgi:hypothetical protein